MRILPLAGILALLACSPKESPDATPPAPTPSSLTLAQFQSLRWIQGTWRGTGEGIAPFYESYLFLDDSTIRTFAYADSTLAQANDSGVIHWSEGAVKSVSADLHWLVTEFDSTHVRFDPLQGAANSFIWTPTSAAEWRTTLFFRDADGTEHSRVYLMQRVGS